MNKDIIVLIGMDTHKRIPKFLIQPTKEKPGLSTLVELKLPNLLSRMATFTYSFLHA
jgi:hypothetical protein